MFIYIYTYVHIYIYIYIYMFGCMYIHEVYACAMDFQGIVKSTVLNGK